MKINVAEATSRQLDWLVAKCEDEETHYHKGILQTRWTTNGYSPSTNWAQGGPIIEREEISVEFNKAGFKELWTAYKLGTPYEDNPQGGPTPLIAAMRCLVASKLGDEVEVPDEL